ncbi:uncharacterized protein LOC142332733 isoform X2 [Lycorma delicatula]
MELNREFVASLLAHCFFSTFPKRTIKTHPTLQDFNFTNFFKHLEHNFQKSKLCSFLHYFSVLEKNGAPPSKIVISRQIMSGKEWLTIEDWLECRLPLCPLIIRHEGRLERVGSEHLLVCFSSSRVGGHVLFDGSSRECIQYCTCPELLVMLLCCEALEDNEVVTVEGVLQVARISDPRNKARIETVPDPQILNVCCMDAENYSVLPLSQYEEDNLLRELNKSLLGFRQRPVGIPPPPSTRRLSPIGESFSSTPPELQEEYQPSKLVCNNKKQDNFQIHRKFILLGSSGECLPISRHQPSHLLRMTHSSSQYSSCHSEVQTPPEEFHSARTSIGDGDYDAEGDVRRYSEQLDTPERRHTFAQRLREALCRASSESSSESSYAVGISVTGSSTADNEIRMRRGGSRGFMLEEDKLERGWGEGRHAEDMSSVPEQKRNHGNSSKYSFSTDYTSELEDVYEQLGSWLEEMDQSHNSSDSQSEWQRIRDIAVVQFAGSLLKRTLSESFVGVPMTEGDAVHQRCDKLSRVNDPEQRNNIKLSMAARSLSLELARHKHKLAAQLVSVLGQKCENGGSALKSIATGNWGCGARQLGDPQLKLLIQWLAASVAGVPALLYFTCSHYKLLKLDTVCRVLLDRQWSVGELVRAILRFIQQTLCHPCPQDVPSLFEQIIGTEEKVKDKKNNSDSSDNSPTSGFDS